jgi:hypothetical protein
VFAAVFKNQSPGCIDDLFLSYLRVFSFFCHDSSPIKEVQTVSWCNG